MVPWSFFLGSGSQKSFDMMAAEMMQFLTCFLMSNDCVLDRLWLMTMSKPGKWGLSSSSWLNVFWRAFFFEMLCNPWHDKWRLKSLLDSALHCKCVVFGICSKDKNWNIIIKRAIRGPESECNFTFNELVARYLSHFPDSRFASAPQRAWCCSDIAMCFCWC